MQKFVYSCLAVYFGFYLFEGPIRYVLNLVGADSLIFVRDMVLAFPLLLIIFFKQLFERRLHPAFYVFAVVIVVHGLISYFNIGSVFVILYSIKMLQTLLIGAVIAPYMMQPPKKVVWAVFALWIITFFGVLIDKYDLIAYPWTGLSTTIGDIQVEVTRNWTITGFDKRAGGLMRSSINVALITPLLAIILLFNLRSYILRLSVIIMTLFILYWTTQKAAIVAFFMVAAIFILFPKRPAPALKLAISLAIILMIALPIILPQFMMPHDKGMFSMESFYMRVEEMWPQAWLWIERRGIFPFGVGLGGIGGAQRFYDIDSTNAADNMFILLYAYFGVFSLLYLGWLWGACMRVKNNYSPATAQALSVALFICFYGVALSMIEDMMASLFLGAAMGWIGSEARKNNAG